MPWTIVEIGKPNGSVGSRSAVGLVRLTIHTKRTLRGGARAVGTAAGSSYPPLDSLLLYLQSFGHDSYLYTHLPFSSLLCSSVLTLPLAVAIALTPCLFDNPHSIANCAWVSSHIRLSSKRNGPVRQSRVSLRRRKASEARS